ncbi:MAG: MMPL family transporter [Rhodothermales bacterium]|nr:MMPL family transporter [Rhodothermales bacterium]
MISEKFSEQTARLIARATRTPWLITWLFVFAGLIFLASRLETRLLKSDFGSSSPGQLDPFRAQLQEELGKTERAVVYLESESPIPLAKARLIFDYIIPRLDSLDEVSVATRDLGSGYLDYARGAGLKRLFLYLDPYQLELFEQRISPAGILASVDDLRTTGSSGLDFSREFKAKDPLGLLGLAALALKNDLIISEFELADGFITTKDRRRYFVLLNTETADNSIHTSRKVVRGIEEIFRSATTDPQLQNSVRGIEISVVGRPVSYLSALETFDSDIRRVGLVGALAILLFLVAYFRSGLTPLLLAIPVSFGIAGALAVAYLVYGSVSLISLIFIGVIIGLGVDIGIHVFVSFRAAMREGLEKSLAIQRAISRPGPAILLASLSTCLAFSALWLITFPVIQQIALLTCVGVLGTVVGSIAFLPAMITRFNIAGRGGHRESKLLSRLKHRSGNRTIVLASWFIILSICAASVAFIRFEPHPWRLALRGNPKTAEMHKLNRELGLSFSPVILASSAPDAEAALEKDRRAVELLRLGTGRARIAGVETLSDWIPSKDNQITNARFISEHAGSFSRDRFIADYNDAAALLRQEKGADVPYLTDSYRDQIASFLNPDLETFGLTDLEQRGIDTDRYLKKVGSDYVNVSYVYLEQFPWEEGVIPRLMETFERASRSQNINSFWLGNMIQGRANRATLQRDFTRAILLSALLVFLVLFARMRNLQGIVLCILPAIAGVLASMGVMALLDIELNMLTLSIVPILIGLGVDDGIHIVERLRRGESMNEIIPGAGSALTVTTLTTVIAFLCMSLATFDGVREAGIVGSVGLLVALLASLHLVPAIKGSGAD